MTRDHDPDESLARIGGFALMVVAILIVLAGWIVYLELVR